MRTASSRRGQSTIELAIIAPLLVMLIAATLQVGLVISDQVNLSHFAYEGGQWLQANRTTGTTGLVKQHIYQELCGNTSGTHSASAPTRYCRDASNPVTVNVTTYAPTAMAGPGPSFAWFNPVQDVEAAAGCTWGDLVFTPASGSAGATVPQGGTLPVTVTLTGAPTGTTLSLAESNDANGLANGTPLFNPPTITDTAPSTQVKLQPTSRTKADPVTGTTYTLHVTGQDQSGVSCSKDFVFTVTTGPPGPPPFTTGLRVDAVVPQCVSSAALVNSLNIQGLGFLPGATVTVGSLGATSVNVIGANQVTATVAQLTPGVYNMTITNPSGTTTTLVNGLQSSPSCPTAPTGNSVLCAPSSSQPGALAVQISITWKEPLVIPYIANTIGVGATQKVFCQ